VYIYSSGASFPRSLGIVMPAKAGNQYLELVQELWRFAGIYRNC
jgi:hypothetical protein